MSARPEEVPAGSGRLAGRVALVSGAGAVGPGWGIGRAIAALVAAEGATVLAVDRDAEALARTAALIAAAGGHCATAVADVTDAEAVAAAVTGLSALRGAADILINNVGAGGPGGVLSTTPEQWRASLERNLSSAFYMTRAVLPGMLARGGGALVHVASVAGQRHLGHDALPYSVAKAGLLHFSRMVAIEHARDGIRSNTVSPGLIDTPEIRRRNGVEFGAGNVGSVTAMRAATVPNGRLGTPWDIARAVVWLASDEADYVTGADIAVDGGAICRSIDSYLVGARRHFAATAGGEEA